MILSIICDDLVVSSGFYCYCSSLFGLYPGCGYFMSVSFCLPHPVAVSAFIISSGLCACTEML